MGGLKSIDAILDRKSDDCKIEEREESYPRVWWLSNVLRSFPVFASQRRIERSPDPVNMNDPDKETVFTAALWSSNINSGSNKGNE